jgi:hypothetical protein
MHKKSFSVRDWTQRLVVLAVSLAVFTATRGSAAEVLAGVSANGRLVLFSSDNPRDVAVVKIKGLQRQEKILGLDVRPATGQLYALGSSSRIYGVDFLTGMATEIGSGPFSPALNGSRFGFDFNPTVDRIRIVSDSGQNLRAHPDTGAIVAMDGNLAYATNDSGFGSTPFITAAAYINNDTNPATGTVLYDIDVARNALVIQNPPNTGTLVTVGSLGVNITGDVGFDVAGGDGTAYASLVREEDYSERAGLYTIDLTTGVAKFMGRIGGPKPLTSLTALGQLH